jgi:threonine dehydratase
MNASANFDTSILKLDDIKRAAERISGRVIRTPTIASTGLSEDLGRETVLKLENHQNGGSFKVRGVWNKLLSLTPEELSRDLVAVSGGNFGIAIAEVGRALGAHVVVTMPKSAPKASSDRICRTGAEVIIEPDVVAAFARAESLSEEGGLLIDDCGDPLITAGQGTLGLEMVEDRPDLTDIFVSIGGGTLIAGVATAVKAVKPEIRVWGVQTIGADCASKALAAGRPVETPVTSVVSTLGVPSISVMHFESIRSLVEDVLVVSDADAIGGVIEFAEKAKVWAEPAAGTLLPAIRAAETTLPEDAVVGFVICGGNATYEDIARWAKQFEH